MVEVVVSPKFQFHVVIVPVAVVVWSVKIVGLLKHTVGAVKVVTGFGFTVITSTSVSGHPLVVAAMSVTE